KRVTQNVAPADAWPRKLPPLQVAASPHALVTASEKLAPPRPPDKMIPTGGAAHVRLCSAAAMSPTHSIGAGPCRIHTIGFSPDTSTTSVVMRWRLNRSRTVPRRHAPCAAG